MLFLCLRMKDQAVSTHTCGPFALSIQFACLAMAFSAPCLEKGGVPTAHKVERCRLSVKARVDDFLQSRCAVRRCPPWLQPSWEEVTGSRASRPRVLSACELRPSAREEKVFSPDLSPIVNCTLKKSSSQSTRRRPFFKLPFLRHRSPYRWCKRIRIAIED